jgi:hypothetical protein
MTTQLDRNMAQLAEVVAHSVKHGHVPLEVVLRIADSCDRAGSAIDMSMLGDHDLTQDEINVLDATFDVLAGLAAALRTEMPAIPPPDVEIPVVAGGKA